MAVKKHTNRRIIPSGKVQENFNIKSELQEAVKDIAHAENISKSDLYNLAVEKYIYLYEKKNGKIKKRPKGEGLV